MKRLLKADFYCLFKSKLTIVLFILAIALPFFTSLIYLGINTLLEITREEQAQLLTFTSRTVIGGTFNLSGDISLIMPIFSGILIGADLTSGTLRNKLIIGHSKAKIYFSHLISISALHLAIGTVYAALTAGFAMAFFQYGKAVDGEEVQNLVFFYIVGMVGFVFIATIVSAFALIFKTPAPTILITVLTCVVLGLVSSLVNVVDYSSFKYLVYFIPSFANGQFATANGIDVPIFVEGLVSYIFFGGAFVLTGLLFFTKKDIK